jgi:hypothetical protein
VSDVKSKPKEKAMSNKTVSATLFAAVTVIALVGLANYALTPSLFTFAGAASGMVIQFVGTMAALAISSCK